MTTLIEFRNVTKSYKIGEVSIKALNGVDFTIDEAEFVVILGASGAGKSTILNILGGMDTASTGQVWVGGQEITEFNENKLTQYHAVIYVTVLRAFRNGKFSGVPFGTPDLHLII